MNWIGKLSIYFAAGSLGGLVNSLVLWLFGSAGINQALGVKIAPAFTPAWLYPRIVWGGLWGLLFFLPLLRNKILLKGIVISLGPTLAQLFYFFPVVQDKGMMGLDLGGLTPLLVVFFNIIWGLAAAIWLKGTDTE